MELQKTLKKVLISIISIVLIIVIGLVVVWLTQKDNMGTESFQGAIHDISQENRMFVLREGKLIQNESGETIPEYNFHTFYWNNDTKFTGGNFRDLTKSTIVNVSSPKRDEANTRQATKITIKKNILQ